MEENIDKKEDSSIKELIKYAVIAIIIVIPFRIFVAQPYIVDGSSMDPTFKNADYLIVDQLSKRFEVPERGSVVIIRYPKDPSKFFIKRLIGFPRERIVINSGKVSIYNDSSSSPIELDESYVVYSKKENFSMQLGENEYFVMGDNRAGSSDSRIWGSLPRENIVGTPIVRLLPIKNISLFPGRIK